MALLSVNLGPFLDPGEAEGARNFVLCLWVSQFAVVDFLGPPASLWSGLIVRGSIPHTVSCWYMLVVERDIAVPRFTDTTGALVFLLTWVGR